MVVHIKGNLKIIKFMDMERIYANKQVINIKVYINKVKDMDKV
jgi:hypothetical protein